MEETPIIEETQIVEAEVISVEPAQELPVEEGVVETTVPETPVCDSCGTVAELTDVPHHQVGNNTVWHYCKRCKFAHDVEVATIERLREVMSVNPAAADDPVFVSDIRKQITQDLLNA